MSGNVQITPIKALADNYIWALEHHGKVTIVDPGDAAPVLEWLKERNLSCDYILLTHFHSDHIAGIEAILSSPEGEFTDVLAPSIGDSPASVTQHIVRDENFHVSDLSFHAIHTPGHASEHFVYHCASDNILFAGDCLFPLGCGRLFGAYEKDMWNSMVKLARLPDETKVFSGHEYTLTNLRFCEKLEPENQQIASRADKIRKTLAEKHCTMPSTMREEKETNPFLRTEQPHWKTTLNLAGAATALDVFTELRARRSNFS